MEYDASVLGDLLSRFGTLKHSDTVTDELTTLLSKRGVSDDDVKRLVQTYLPVICHNFRFSSIVTSDKLGEGSFGSVWKGKVDSGQMVAIKKYSMAFDYSILREISSLCRIKGHNLVPLLSICTMRNMKTSIVLPLADSTLYMYYSTVLAKKDKDRWQSVKDIMFKLITGMLSIENHRAIHCDIKPENILMSGDYPWIADFGAMVPCKVIGVEESACIQTYPWRAPEIYLDYRHYTGAIDVWSMGILFAELCSTSSTYKQIFDYDEKQVLFEIFKLTGTPQPGDKTYFTDEGTLRPFCKKTLSKYDAIQRSGWRERMRTVLFTNTICPRNMQDVIISMLDIEPTNRPTFSQILNFSVFSEYEKPVQIPFKRFLEPTHNLLISNFTFAQGEDMIDALPRREIAKAYSWLYQIVAKLIQRGKMKGTELSHTFAIINKFIERDVTINVCQLKHMMASALLIASHVMTDSSLESNDIQRYDKTFTEDKCIAMHEKILRTLRFRVAEPTLLNFIDAKLCAEYDDVHPDECKESCETYSLVASICYYDMIVNKNSRLLGLRLDTIAGMIIERSPEIVNISPISLNYKTPLEDVYSPILARY